MNSASAIGSNVESIHRARIAMLFRDEQRALLAFLQCKLGSLADAQETAQEAFERLLALDAAAQVESLRAYLFRVAGNLAVDRLRARRLREQTPAPAADAPEWHLAPAPERHVAAGEDFHRLRAALRELPAKSARAFVMHVIEGREFGAIARHMKLSERMVRYHVTRALAHCRERTGRNEAPA